MISASVGFNTALCFAQGHLLIPLFLNIEEERNSSQIVRVAEQNLTEGVSLNLQH